MRVESEVRLPSKPRPAIPIGSSSRSAGGGALDRDQQVVAARAAGDTWPSSARADRHVPGQRRVERRTGVGRRDTAPSLVGGDQRRRAPRSGVGPIGIPPACERSTRAGPGRCRPGRCRRASTIRVPVRGTRAVEAAEQRGSRPVVERRDDPVALARCRGRSGGGTCRSRRSSRPARARRGQFPTVGPRRSIASTFGARRAIAGVLRRRMPQRRAAEPHASAPAAQRGHH